MLRNTGIPSDKGMRPLGLSNGRKLQASFFDISRKLARSSLLSNLGQTVFGSLRFWDKLPKWFWLRHPVVGVVPVRVQDGLVIRYHSHGEYTGRVLYWRGMFAYEEGTTSLFYSLAQRSNAFLDIGAHVGVYTLLAAAANPSLRGYAFEPIPLLCQQLCTNVELNGYLNRVVIERRAMSDRVETNALFFVAGDPAMSSLNQDAARGDVRETLQISCETVDHFVHQRALAALDLIKIDVEGAETKVLNGAKRTLKAHRPVIICEILARNAEAFTTVAGLLDEMEYGYGAITKQGVLSLSSLAPVAGTNNYLFWPYEKRAWIRALSSGAL